jgi:hypothetical protein
MAVFGTLNFYPGFKNRGQVVGSGKVLLGQDLTGARFGWGKILPHFPLHAFEHLTLTIPCIKKNSPG